MAQLMAGDVDKPSPWRMLERLPHRNSLATAMVFADGIFAAEA